MSELQCINAIVIVILLSQVCTIRYSVLLYYFFSGKKEKSKASDAVELAKNLGRLKETNDPRASVRSTASDDGTYANTKDILRKGTVYRSDKIITHFFRCNDLVRLGLW